MKRFLAIVLTLALLATFGAFSALAESGDTYGFSASMMNSVDATVDDWYWSAETRALATVVLALDLMYAVDYDNSLSPDLSSISYVGKDGEDLMVYVHTGVYYDELILYRPRTGEALFVILDPTDDSSLLYTLDSMCSDGCYRNDPGMVASVAMELLNAM